MKKKAKVYVIAIIVILCLIVYVGLKKNKNNELQVVALPASNKIIILDAGHGLPDEGTIGFSGTPEQKINLDIVLKLQKLFEQSGATIILTRSDENGIYETNMNSIRTKKLSDMKNRVYIGNNSGANIFLSIHLNYYTESKYSGWQTFYQKENVKSKHLSEFLQQELTSNIGKNNRVPKTINDSYILRKIEIPSVIIECGFLSNQEEEQKLQNEEYQSKLAWGIYIGVQKYFEENL